MMPTTGVPAARTILPSGARTSCLTARFICSPGFAHLLVTFCLNTRLTSVPGGSRSAKAPVRLARATVAVRKALVFMVCTLPSDRIPPPVALDGEAGRLRSEHSRERERRPAARRGRRSRDPGLEGLHLALEFRQADPERIEPL